MGLEYEVYYSVGLISSSFPLSLLTLSPPTHIHTYTHIPPSNICLLRFNKMSTQWSLDFCLVCDRQTSGGPYCSQSCRLSELDQSPSEREPTRSSTFDSKNMTARSARSLSASSSQTSLSSLPSHAPEASFAHHLQGELRDYASCFDPVRALKRRLTSS